MQVVRETSHHRGSCMFEQGVPGQDVAAAQRAAENERQILLTSIERRIGYE